MLRCVNTVRVIGRYRVLGRNACMVFYFTIAAGHAPTAEDVAAIAHNYVDWERGGLGVLGGYSDLRSDQSALVATEAQSIDPVGESFLYVDAATVDGLIPGVDAQCLPTTLAPLVYWRLSADAQRRPGRTYAVGFAAHQIGTVDLLRINATDRLATQTVFELLRASMADSGAIMVMPRYRVLGSTPFPAPTWPVESCFNVDEYLSSRRIRSRGVVGGGGPG